MAFVAFLALFAVRRMVFGVMLVAAALFVMGFVSGSCSLQICFAFLPHRQKFAALAEGDGTKGQQPHHAQPLQGSHVDQVKFNGLI